MKAGQIAVGVAACLILAACGGGGGGDGSPSASMMDAPPPSYPINTITVGDLLIYAQGQQTRATAACSGTVCTFSYGGQSTQIDISDIDPRDTSSAILTNQQTRNGVSIARLRETVDGLRIDTYGAWGNYNVSIGGRGATTVSGIPIDIAMPLSLGYSVGTNPVSGSATWTGAMVGSKIEATRRGAEVIGDARLQADLAAASLDLSFTNIGELSSGARSPDIVWQGVSMQRGAFQANGLDGRFYGPNHEEAGGVFERDRIIGAFSLTRQ